MQSSELKIKNKKKKGENIYKRTVGIILTVINWL